MVHDAERLLFDAGCRVFHSPDSKAIRARVRTRVEIPSGDFDDLEMTRVELARIPAGAQEFEFHYRPLAPQTSTGRRPTLDHQAAMQ